eukprot:scaffold126974_cov32-Tisochrysis_lutea.AAC.4
MDGFTAVSLAYPSTMAEKMTSSATVNPIRLVVTPSRMPMRRRAYRPDPRCTAHRSKSKEELAVSLVKRTGSSTRVDLRSSSASARSASRAHCNSLRIEQHGGGARAEGVHRKVAGRTSVVMRLLGALQRVCRAQMEPARAARGPSVAKRVSSRSSQRAPDVWQQRER